MSIAVLVSVCENTIKSSYTFENTIFFVTHKQRPFNL